MKEGGWRRGCSPPAQPDGGGQQLTRRLIPGTLPCPAPPPAGPAAVSPEPGSTTWDCDPAPFTLTRGHLPGSRIPPSCRPACAPYAASPSDWLERPLPRSRSSPLRAVLSRLPLSTSSWRPAAGRGSWEPGCPLLCGAVALALDACGTPQGTGGTPHLSEDLRQQRLAGGKVWCGCGCPLLGGLLPSAAQPEAAHATCAQREGPGPAPSPAGTGGKVCKRNVARDAVSRLRPPGQSRCCRAVCCRRGRLRRQHRAGAGKCGEPCGHRDHAAMRLLDKQEPPPPHTSQGAGPGSSYGPVCSRLFLTWTGPVPAPSGGSFTGRVDAGPGGRRLRGSSGREVCPPASRPRFSVPRSLP